MVRALGGGEGASRRRSLLVAALLAGSALLALGVAVRVVGVHSLDGTNLVWNLFLAWIPFVLALVLYDRGRRGTSAGTLLGLGAAWLLFLPNAPYIVTDVKWLGEYAGGRLWYDAALIGTAGAIGLVLGFVSLYLVQIVVTRRYGHLAGWGVAWAALALSGVGVYLGRFERWNSWDVVTEPTTILGQLARAGLDPLAHGRPLVLSVAFAVTWCVGYGLFYSTFQSRLRRLADG
jgi:uncharacterized membrane protein